MTHAPGKALLKIVGILFIIFSLVTIIVALVGIFSGTAMTVSGAAGLGALMVIGTILSCSSGILQFIAGIFGVKYSDEPERATTCIVLGAIIILLTLINMIWAGFHWTQLFGLVLPVLYFIGAIMNRNAAVE